MRRTIALLALTALGSCMEMRETVERMVMVRTTGSDLQPEATGYIYKKGSDGPGSLVEMGESEVMEQLSKLYEQPKAFAAPIPIAAGPFYAMEEDENKAASHASEAYIIPVKENEEDKHDDKIDGIAEEEDYGKILSGYAGKYGEYKGDFDDYLHSLGYFKDGLYHGHGGGSDYGSKGHHAYGDKGQKGYASTHHYGKGGAGDYHTEKHESFSVSGEGGHNKEYDDADAHGKHYEHGNGYHGADHGHKAAHNKGEAVDGFHKLYDKDEFKKDHDFYDGDALKGGFHKFGHGHAYHGSGESGYGKGDSHESGHYDSGYGKEGFHDKQYGDEHGVEYSGEEGDDSSHHSSGHFGAEGGLHDGKSYGYEVKH